MAENLRFGAWIWWQAVASSNRLYRIDTATLFHRMTDSDAPVPTGYLILNIESEFAQLHLSSHSASIEDDPSVLLPYNADTRWFFDPDVPSEVVHWVTPSFESSKDMVASSMEQAPIGVPLTPSGGTDEESTRGSNGNHWARWGGAGGAVLLSFIVGLGVGILLPRFVAVVRNRRKDDIRLDVEMDNLDTVPMTRPNEEA